MPSRAQTREGIFTSSPPGFYFSFAVLVHCVRGNYNDEEHR